MYSNPNVSQLEPIDAKILEINLRKVFGEALKKVFEDFTKREFSWLVGLTHKNGCYSVCFKCVCPGLMGDIVSRNVYPSELHT
jgi:hypothetical protein